MIQKDLEPEKVNDGATLEAIYQLRVAVWQSVTKQVSSLFPDGRWTDSHDSHSLHWVISDANQVLAAARLCVHHSIAELPGAHLYSDYIELLDTPVASLNRLVVHPSAQGLGFSKKLDLVRRQTAVELGCRAMFVYCWQLSGDARLQSLERQGFRPLAPKNSKVEPPFGAATPLVLLLDLETKKIRDYYHLSH